MKEEEGRRNGCHFNDLKNGPSASEFGVTGC